MRRSGSLKGCDLVRAIRVHTWSCIIGEIPEHRRQCARMFGADKISSGKGILVAKDFGCRPTGQSTVAE
jgi:hypothetical protein